MRNLNKKTLLLGSCALALGLVSGQAMADWGTLNAAKTTTQTATDGKVALNVSGANTLVVDPNGIAADAGALADLSVVVNMTNVTDGIKSTDSAAISAVNLANTWAAGGIAVTKGVVSTGANGDSAISLNGAAGTVNISVGAEGAVKNVATAGNTAKTAIKLADTNGAQTYNLTTVTGGGISSTGSDVSTKVIDLTGMTGNANSTVTITNAGTIAGANGTTTAIDATGMKGALSVTNTGTITGGVKLGGNAASTLTQGSTTTLTGDVILGADQTVTLSGTGGVTGKIDNGAGADNKGTLAVTGDATVTGTIGATNKLKAITIADGKKLTAGGAVKVKDITGKGGSLVLNGGAAVTGSIGAADNALTAITVADGQTLTVSDATTGSGKVFATTITLGSTEQTGGGSLTASNTVTGNIVAKKNGAGTFTAQLGTQNFATGGTIGATDKKLETVVVTGGALGKDTFTVNHNISATNLTIADATIMAVAPLETTVDGAITKLMPVITAAIDGGGLNKGTLAISGGTMGQAGVIGGNQALAAITIAADAGLTSTDNVSATTTTLTGKAALTFAKKSTGNVPHTWTGDVKLAAAGDGSIIIQNQENNAIIAGVIGEAAVGNDPSVTLGSLIVGGAEGDATVASEDGTWLTLQKNAFVKSATVAEKATLKLVGDSIFTGDISGAGAVQLGEGGDPATTGNVAGKIGSAEAPMGKLILGNAATLTGETYVKATVLEADKTLTVSADKVDLGTVDAKTADQGTLAFTKNYATTAAIGGKVSLKALTVTGVKLTANHSITAKDGITLANDTSVLDIAADGLTMSDINAGTGTKGVLNVLGNFEAKNKMAAGTINVGSDTVKGKTLTLSNGLVDAAAGKGMKVFAGNTVAVKTAVTMANADVTNAGTLDLGKGQSLTLTNGFLTAKSGSTMVINLTGEGTKDTAAGVDGKTATAYALDLKAGKLTLEDGASIKIATTALPVEGAIFNLASATGGVSVAGTNIASKYAFVSYAIAADKSGKLLQATASRIDAAKTYVSGTAEDKIMVVFGDILAGKVETADKEYFAPFNSMTQEEAKTAVAEVLTSANNAGIQSMKGAAGAAASAIDSIITSMSSGGEKLGSLGGQAVAAGNQVVMGANGIEFWARLDGSKEFQNKMDGYLGYNANSYGFTMGANTRLMDGVNGGLAFTMGRSFVHEKVNTASKTNINSYLISLYGSYSPTNTWFVDGILSGGSGRYDQYRTDPVADGVLYNGKFGGTVFAGTAKVGQNMKVGDGMTMRPFVAMSLGSTTIDAHSETGGGKGAITSPKARINTAQLGVGASVSMTQKVMDDWTMTPTLKVAYMHEFCSKARVINVTMAGAPIPLATTRFASEILSGGLGVKMENSSGMSVSVDYSATGKDNYMSHSGMLRVGKKF